MRHDHLRHKAPLESEKQYDEHMNNNCIHLKVEEMAFKFKTKIVTILKEIAIPASDLAKYSSLNKIDGMVYFLSQKIKQKLCLSQNSESNTSRLPSRFYRRTLPHFSKDDNSPESRGFVFSNFVIGLKVMNTSSTPRRTLGLIRYCH